MKHLNILKLNNPLYNKLKTTFLLDTGKNKPTLDKENENDYDKKSLKLNNVYILSLYINRVLMVYLVLGTITVKATIQV